MALLPLAQAVDEMLKQLPTPSQCDFISLEQAANRICAQAITSPINVPSFDNSAMDGYAVRCADLNQSMTLTVAGKAFAGNPFTGEMPVGSCVRIMTGAKIPAYATCG